MQFWELDCTNIKQDPSRLFTWDIHEELAKKLVFLSLIVAHQYTEVRLWSLNCAHKTFGSDFFK